MKRHRSGMTLFELLIVITIVGIIYSLGLFALKSDKTTSSEVTLSSIRTTLSGITQGERVRLICGIGCEECRILGSNDTLIATVQLLSDGGIERYEFDRDGRLEKLGNPIIRERGVLKEACLDYSLTAEGIASPMILKSREKYYLYEPTGEPYVTRSEEALRSRIFDQQRYLISGDDYYAAH